ncbi:MAG: MXAN_2562 family outer membrane beta-barrel protein [Myxococcota bacterium]
MIRLLTIAALAASMLPSMAAAQSSDELRARARRESSEFFGFELKVGTYRPEARAVGGGSAWQEFFGGDRGPLLQLEFDVFAYRIPYVGLIGGGVSAGWARYERGLCDPNTGCGGGGRLDEDGNARLYPVAGLAVLRVDTLSRYLGIPFVFTGKIGADIFFYRITGGGSASGRSVGLRWALQFALELDFINRTRARSLDDEWGINHTTLFFEIFGSTADSEIDLGQNLAWTAGLGMTF